MATASRNNDRDLREGDIIQGQKGHSDRKGKGGDNKMPRTCTSKAKVDEGVAEDKAKECGPTQKRYGSNYNYDGGNKIKISKRRRLNKPHPRPRFNIPEARVAQAFNFNERAYIYDSEPDDDKDKGDFPIEANAAGVVAVPGWLQQKIQHLRLKEEKMKNKARKNGDGKSHHTHKRCHCFDF